jgi:hypothetical protein
VAEQLAVPAAKVAAHRLVAPAEKRTTPPGVPCGDVTRAEKVAGLACRTVPGVTETVVEVAD